MKEIFRVTPPGATTEELADLQATLGYGLPSAYLQFLAETNGAQLGVHDSEGDCLRFWWVSEIVQLNQEYQIQRWLPHVLAIGSDGGGDAVVFDKSSSSSPDEWAIARVGFGALDVEEMVFLANSFADWAVQEFRLIKGV